jgi:hypothetical protein
VKIFNEVSVKIWYSSEQNQNVFRVSLDGHSMDSYLDTPIGRRGEIYFGHCNRFGSTSDLISQCIQFRMPKAAHYLLDESRPFGRRGEAEMVHINLMRITQELNKLSQLSLRGFTALFDTSFPRQSFKFHDWSFPSIQKKSIICFLKGEEPSQQLQVILRWGSIDCDRLNENNTFRIPLIGENRRFQC